MQVVHIVKRSFIIKYRCLFFILLLDLGNVQFFLILYFLRCVANDEKAFWISLLFIFEFFLDFLQSDISYFFYKGVELLKQGVVHYQQQNWMHFKIVYLYLLFASISCQCFTKQNNTLPSAYQKYLTANSLNISQQKTIIELYQKLTNLSSYKINMSITNYSIYINNQPLCIKSTRNITFNALFDIWLCLDDYFLLQCNQQWQLLIKCGTYLEIHRPFDVNVLISFNVEDILWTNDSNKIKVANLPLNKLCAGLYHIWFVYYSRQGMFIKRVRTIYISFPSCKC